MAAGECTKSCATGVPESVSDAADAADAPAAGVTLGCTATVSTVLALFAATAGNVTALLDAVVVTELASAPVLEIALLPALHAVNIADDASPIRRCGAQIRVLTRGDGMKMFQADIC